MNCPKCKAGFSHIHITDSRESKEYGVRRRRECEVCGHRFTTYEITDIQKAKYDQTERWKKETTRKIKTLLNSVGG